MKTKTKLILKMNIAVMLENSQCTVSDELADYV